MDLGLRDRVVIITGSGRGIGAESARILAREGARLVITDLDAESAQATAEAMRSDGHDAIGIGSDVLKADDAKAVADLAMKIYGRIDVLVNNAAIFWPTTLEQLDESELDTFYAVNLRAPFALASEIGRAMKQRCGAGGGGGAILNIACLSGLRAWKTHVPYSISKAGVVSLTQGLAKLLAPEVRVNAIAPGSVLPPESADPAEIEFLRAKIPLKKIGSPDDVVDAAMYALTAPFMTGQILCVDGGRSLV